jgi:hypothetical protein
MLHFVRGAILPTQLCGVIMKKFVAIALLLASGIAAAACPAGTRYQCYSTPSGKMQCGCY